MQEREFREVADPHVLSSLAELLGATATKRLVTSFARSTAQRISEAQAASAAGDLDALRQTAHAVRSSAANLGATEMARLAADIEHGQGATATCPPAEQVASLAAAGERATAALQAFADMLVE